MQSLSGLCAINLMIMKIVADHGYKLMKLISKKRWINLIKTGNKRSISGILYIKGEICFAVKLIYGICHVSEINYEARLSKVDWPIIYWPCHNGRKVTLEIPEYKKVFYKCHKKLQIYYKEYRKLKLTWKPSIQKINVCRLVNKLFSSLWHSI